MFRLNRNERSHWSGNGVHVEPESVFMISRNMHDEQNRLWEAQQSLLAQQKEQLTTTAKIYRALGGSDSVAPR